MRSKVIFGHPKWPPAAILKKKSKEKLRFDLKWPVMRLKVIFGHPKWPPAAILLKKIKVAYWSEMARNVIKSDFRSSKMDAGSHFVTKNKSCVLIWNGEKCDQKWFSVIQNGRRQPFCAKKSKKIKVAYWPEIARNAIESDFRSCKMAAGSHCEKKSCVLIGNGEKWDQRWFFGHPKWGGGGGAHHNGQPVNHSGIYTVFALGQIHQF